MVIFYTNDTHETLNSLRYICVCVCICIFRRNQSLIFLSSIILVQFCIKISRLSFYSSSFCWNSFSRLAIIYSLTINSRPIPINKSFVAYARQGAMKEEYKHHKHFWVNPFFISYLLIQIFYLWSQFWKFIICRYSSISGKCLHRLKDVHGNHRDFKNLYLSLFYSKFIPNHLFVVFLFF